MFRKENFPPLLNNLCETTQPNASKDLISGFVNYRIHPVLVAHYLNNVTTLMKIAYKIHLWPIWRKYRKKKLIVVWKENGRKSLYSVRFSQYLPSYLEICALYLFYVMSCCKKECIWSESWWRQWRIISVYIYFKTTNQEVDHTIIHF